MVATREQIDREKRQPQRQTRSQAITKQKPEQKRLPDPPKNTNKKKLAKVTSATSE